MNKLLQEFLSYIWEDRQERKPGTSWSVDGNWYGKNSAGETRSFGSQEAADRFAKGKSLEKKAKDKETSKPKTQKEPETIKRKTSGKPKPKGTKKVKTVDTSGLSSTSDTVRNSVSTIPGGEGAWAAVTGQIKIPRVTGAGTPESKAAEASVVIVSNSLIRNKPEGMSMKEYLDTPEAQKMVDSMISDLQSVKGSRLNDSWVPTVRAQVTTLLSKTEEVYGEIDSIVWDNEAGRNEFGLGKKTQEDRSDAYVRLKDGKIIGTSLKKNGKVFLANLGYRTSMTRMTKFTSDAKTQEELLKLRELHSDGISKVITRVMTDFRQNEDLQNKVRTFNRRNHPDLQGEDYDRYFDKKGNVNPILIDELLTGQITRTSPRTKTLLKILGKVSPESVADLREVDAESTRQFMSAVQQNPEMRRTTTRFLMDQLDIPQMISSQPFGEGSKVSAITTVYGEGNPSETGDAPPLFVNGNTIKKLLNIPEGASEEEARKLVEDNFIIDSESDSPSGIVRLRIVNPSKKPPYYYPIMATVALRSRGPGSAATMECLQHDSWTTSLSAGSPNPADWTPDQRAAQAKSTIQFLHRQLQTASSDEQRKAIEDEIRTYGEIYKDNK